MSMSARPQRFQKKTAHPKARDYDEFGKELVLAAANIYCALLASRGMFLNPSKELKLIKKAWKLVNTESGVKPLALTPSIVMIVSKFLSYQFILLLFFCSSRLKLEAPNFGARRKQKRPPWSRLYTTLTVDRAKGPLQRIRGKLRS